MRRLLLVVTTLMVVAVTKAEHRISLSELYSQIDEAIERSVGYVADYEKKILSVKNRYLVERSTDRKAALALELYELYKSYDNDSALAYIGYCIQLSESHGRPEMAAHARALMAQQCATVGMYTESADLLRQVDKAVLTHQGLSDYYNACMHLCGEIGANTQIDKVREYYFERQEAYRDSFLTVLDHVSLNYMRYKEAAVVNQGNYEEALRINDQWMNAVSDGTHDHAIAAYYRYVIYQNLNDVSQMKYWLARSALDDIRCAVMDQASLIELAKLLNNDGDVDRSYRYIRFTWQCNNHFNTRMRSWQISPILTVIERNFQKAADRDMHILTMAAVFGGILVLVLLLTLLYVRHQKRKVQKAHNDLEETNQRLLATNEKLRDMNACVTRYNRELYDIKRQLEESNHQLAEANQKLEEQHTPINL